MSADSEHRDALVHGRVRGRAAGINPGNRFDDRGGGVVRLHVLGSHLDRMAAEQPRGVQVATEVIPDATRRIINRVDSPDLPLKWTLNPYRGCEHGCAYCYARPTHEALGFSCGLDFESKIVAKHDAPKLLRRELAAPSWRGEPIAMSGVTDPYQPLERTLEITRGCLEVMAECRQPVAIVTKSRLVVRDVDLLRTLAEHDAVRVAVSVTTLDARLSRSMEPRASAPDDRLRAIRELTEAGIPVQAMIAPVIPGLTDHEIPELVQAVADAGAHDAAWIMLRLPYQLKDVFMEWLERCVPERAARVERALRDVRGGSLSSPRYGERMRGTGARADHVARTMEVFARRAGLVRVSRPMNESAFRRPCVDGQPDGQMVLFERERG
ncbi:MAG: PA0069 family radical SAM protein [Planctomycetota bacterium]|jgi:DNA repair photolyase